MLHNLTLPLNNRSLNCCVFISIIVHSDSCNVTEESPNVESTTTSSQDVLEEHNDEPSSPEKQAKLVQNPEETYQREIDILQKLFPQKDKVNYENFWFKCVNIAKSLSMKINFN